MKWDANRFKSLAALHEKYSKKKKKEENYGKVQNTALCRPFPLSMSHVEGGITSSLDIGGSRMMLALCGLDTMTHIQKSNISMSISGLFKGYTKEVFVL